MAEVQKPRRAIQNLGGRPTKLDEKLIEEICEYIKMGNYIEICCGAVGVSKSMFYRWLQEGKDATSGLKKKFRDAVNQAYAISEVRDIARIDRAGEQGDWRALAWKRERRSAERWGRRDTVAVEHGGAIATVVVDERRKALRAVAEDPAMREALIRMAHALRPARGEAQADVVEGQVITEGGGGGEDGDK